MCDPNLRTLVPDSLQNAKIGDCLWTEMVKIYRFSAEKWEKEEAGGMITLFIMKQKLNIKEK